MSSSIRVASCLAVACLFNACVTKSDLTGTERRLAQGHTSLAELTEEDAAKAKERLVALEVEAKALDDKALAQEEKLKGALKDIGGITVTIGDAFTNGSVSESIALLKKGADVFKDALDKETHDREGLNDAVRKVEADAKSEREKLEAGAKAEREALEREAKLERDRLNRELGLLKALKPELRAEVQAVIDDNTRLQAALGKLSDETKAAFERGLDAEKVRAIVSSGASVSAIKGKLLDELDLSAKDRKDADSLTLPQILALLATGVSSVAGARLLSKSGTRIDEANKRIDTVAGSAGSNDTSPAK